MSKEQDKIDAERYRFIRDNIREDHALPGGYYLTDKRSKIGWDKTIDTAMKEAKHNG